MVGRGTLRIAVNTRLDERDGETIRHPGFLDAALNDMVGPNSSRATYVAVGISTKSGRPIGIRRFARRRAPISPIPAESRRKVDGSGTPLTGVLKISEKLGSLGLLA